MTNPKTGSTGFTKPPVAITSEPISRRGNMRAEMQTLINETKQSLELLRRRL